MRVAHIVPALFGSTGVIGGAERYAWELARHMSRRLPTTLVSFGTRPESWRDGQLDVRVLSHIWYVRGQRFNPLAPGLTAQLRRADVVHCHQLHVMASSLSALYCRATGKRVFVSDLGGGGFDLSAYVSTDNWFHGHLHISSFSRHSSGHDSMTRARVVYGGVDTEKFSPSAEPPASDRPVLFVGRLLPHKGVDDLIEAMPEDVPLEIIGPAADADYAARLRAMAAGKRITFRHQCNDEELITAYRSALCIVLPSVYRSRFGPETEIPELLGQTLLEGMSCGIPAVCTRVASMPELVQSGVQGLVVEPNSPVDLRAAILYLRNHPEEARRMGAAGRQRVLREFTWELVVNRCLESYAGAQ